MDDMEDALDTEVKTGLLDPAGEFFLFLFNVQDRFAVVLAFDDLVVFHVCGPADGVLDGVSGQVRLREGAQGNGVVVKHGCRRRDY